MLKWRKICCVRCAGIVMDEMVMSALCEFKDTGILEMERASDGEAQVMASWKGLGLYISSENDSSVMGYPTDRLQRTVTGEHRGLALDHLKCLEAGNRYKGIFGADFGLIASIRELLRRA